jgi:adenosine kinase
MSILVSGSVALDHIMVFPDRFSNHILADKVHALNVSFNITSLKTHFGGVAANIAYHLRWLGAEPLILATVGSDFAPYAEWLDKNGIRRDHIKVYGDVRTPQGFVTTDLADNQIWAFYEGAMARAHEARVEDVSGPIELGIVSSNGKPILDRAELVELIDGAAGYLVNDYEWSLTLEQSGLSEAEIEGRCESVIITKGPEGSEIRAGGERIAIPPVATQNVVDPTGCGDAYRAGFLFGIANGHPPDVAGRMGSLYGSCQVEVEGTQSLQIDLASFRERYAAAFGKAF